ncbi:MAG: EAL domain-containing protein [Methylomarinum sp.]|nr:EAL domain-containing protein [Methylomarinum sp.]
MYPIKGNEAAIGLDYRKLPSQFAAVNKARVTRQLVLAGPVKLVQGGTGLITRLPVFIKKDQKETFWGIVSAVIDANLLFKRSGLLDDNLAIDIAIRGKDSLGSDGDVFFGNPDLFKHSKLKHTLELPYGSWQLAARPKEGWTTLPKNIGLQRAILSAIALAILIIITSFIRSTLKASLANRTFLNLLENAPIPYAVNTKDQTISYVNKTFTETYGYTLEDIPTLHEWWIKAYPNPTYRQQVKESWFLNLEKFKSTGMPFEPLEVDIQCKSGEIKTVLASPTTLDIASEENHLIVLYDITKRKLNEQQLQLSSQVFKGTQEGIIITDPEGGIIDVNPAFCRITGYSLQEVIGQNPKILSSGKQSAEFYDNMWDTLNQKGYWQGELWNRKKDGQIYAETLRISSLQDEQGQNTHHIGLFSDITHKKEQQKKLELMAHYDVLTQLPNRALFADRFKQAIAHSKRTDTLLAVCFIDLDNFKPVNDQYGHNVGDQLLIKVAHRIKEKIREEDTVSRQGGDEFALLLGNIESIELCEKTLQRIIKALAQPFNIDEKNINISASIGATLYPHDNADLDTLLRHADQAMYQVKQKGRDSFHLFNPTDDQDLIKKQKQLDEIQQALVNNQLCLYYQPKVDMITGTVVGAEALIRWQHPEKGLIPPLDFLPIIADTALEIQIGDWVINESLKQLSLWNAQGIKLELSINISSYHLQSPNFINQLDTVLAKYPKVNSNELQLEILESSALGDLASIRQTIKTCKNTLGLCIALDDFGTGYSSLTHLRNLPVNTIKIDQSFVRDMLDDPNDFTIIDGVIGLSHSFNRAVIAEGVETTEHGLMLLLMGCHKAQGYGISRPIPADQLPDWLHNYKPNQLWIACGNKNYSEKERRIEIFKLIIKQWTQKIETSLQSKNSNTQHWPIMDSKKCQCGIWINRARQDQLFNAKDLDDLDAQHDVMHQLAITLMKQYLAKIDITDDQLKTLKSSIKTLKSTLQKGNPPMRRSQNF